LVFLNYAKSGIDLTPGKPDVQGKFNRGIKPELCLAIPALNPIK
jgi:hypothetical protein